MKELTTAEDILNAWHDQTYEMLQLMHGVERTDASAIYGPNGLVGRHAMRISSCLANDG